MESGLWIADWRVGDFVVGWWMKRLSHLDEAGRASMVDVSAKPAVMREAVAEAFIVLGKKTLRMIADGQTPKGDVLAVARVAGIQAAKQTQLLIPLCHQIPLSKVAVDFVPDAKAGGIRITTVARTVAATGVEMEALTAASVAALTIYDMCKAVDKAMRIDGVRLVSKVKG
jgi:cyclic pyranopterin phosphate synthase